MSSDFIQQIRDCVGRLQNDLVDFASELIRIPTVNPPGEHYETCVRTIGDTLDEMGIDWDKVSVPAERLSQLAPHGHGRPRPSLIGRWGQGQRRLHFHGHYDVVPGFSQEQFEPCLSRGRLFGRGAADMKGGLACMLFAIHTLKECHVKLDGTLSFSITPDEETGGTAGLGYLVNSEYLGDDMIGVLDPEPSGGDIINGSRGALSLEMLVKGRSSHVMMQHMGVNAFEKMIEAASAFLELKKIVETRRTSYQVKPAGTEYSILHVGGACGGGINFNIVPDRTFFTVDRRFNPEEEMPEVRGEIEDCLRSLRAQGVDIETRIIQEGESSFVREDEPICQTLSRAAQAVKGRRPDVSICPGLLETRFLVRKGIPAVIYGPGSLEAAHHPDESVRVDDLLDCTVIYALTAAELLAGRVC